MSEQPWQDGMYDLDGFRFGGDRSALLQVAKASDYGGFDVTSGDAELTGHPGLLVGRDTLGSATWTLQVFTNHRRAGHPNAAAAALDALRELAAVWRASSRLPPGVLSRLQLFYAGRLVCLYGRARAAGMPRPDVLTRQGRAVVSLQFRVTDPIVYDAAFQELALGLTQVGDGGAVWPVTWPVEWGRSSVARQGVVHVDGTEPVPFKVVVDGPVAGVASGVQLAGPGWHLDVDVPIPYDKALVIDTRAMTAKVGGVSAADGLSRRTRLNARLSSGNSEVTFSCSDPTHTARATLSWQPGWASL